jgi:hypothetical protein
MIEEVDHSLKSKVWDNVKDIYPVFTKGGVDEALNNEGWVVYDPETKKERHFKKRDMAKRFKEKNGGDMYSRIYFYDNRKEITSA